MTTQQIIDAVRDALVRQTDEFGTLDAVQQDVIVVAALDICEELEAPSWAAVEALLRRVRPVSLEVYARTTITDRMGEAPIPGTTSRLVN